MKTYTLKIVDPSGSIVGEIEDVDLDAFKSELARADLLLNIQAELKRLATNEEVRP